MTDTKTIYTVGGTVQAGGGLYIPRKADQELLELCRAGRLAFILSSRQVGKSSSMVRTAEELRKEGVCSVIIDLSALGVTVTQDEWYLGILNEIANSLELEADIFAWWSQHTGLSPAKRLSNFFRDVMLREVNERVVIFFDEIDSTLSVDFSDDFFAALRAVYNARSTTPDFKRLSFVLIGVATPGDLISDSKRTPFNIGQRVELTDFTLEEAKPLAKGLGDREDVLEWVFEWTSGHPFLTQRLCAHLAHSNGNLTESAVTEAVDVLFIRNRDLQDNNLRFVRDMLLKRAADSPGVLRLYRNILQEKRVEDDEKSQNKSHLKLSGVVRCRELTLRISNRIYRQVFNLEWVKENLPVSRLRYLVAILSTITILALGAAGYFRFIYPQRIQTATQAENYVNIFKTSESVEARVLSLAGLIGMGGEYVDQGKELFKDLRHEEQLKIFTTESSENIENELLILGETFYQEQRNTPEGNELLFAIANSLSSIPNSSAVNLRLEISDWLLGRKYTDQGQYKNAIKSYTNAWKMSQDRKQDNPGVLFDRGVAYIRSAEYDKALKDFDKALDLDDKRGTEVETVIIENQALANYLRDNSLAYSNIPPPEITISPPAITTTTAQASPSPRTEMLIGPGEEHKIGYNYRSIDTSEGVQIIGAAPNKDWVAVFVDGSVGWIRKSSLNLDPDLDIPVIEDLEKMKISGKVTDTLGEPIDGINFAISMQYNGESVRVDTYSDKDGNFYFYMPIVGSGYISSVGVSCDSRIMDSNCRMSGYFELTTSKAFTVPLNESMVFIYERSSVDFTGKIVDSQGNVASDIRVFAKRNDGAVSWGASSSDGNFAIPGSYGNWEFYAVRFNPWRESAHVEVIFAEGDSFQPVTLVVPDE